QQSTAKLRFAGADLAPAWAPPRPRLESAGIGFVVADTNHEHRKKRASSSCSDKSPPALLRSRSKVVAAAIAWSANNPQQSWGFEGEPPEAVIKDSGTRDGTS